MTDIIDVERSVFSGDPRHENDLQEQIPELFAELCRIAVRDGFDYLLGFLEEIWVQGVEGLLAVPRTSPGIAQLIHDGDETIKAR